MEDWLIQIITQVPLAVLILVLWRMDKREFQALERLREQNRAQDERARNGQIDSLIRLQTSYNENIALLRRAIEGYAAEARALTEAAGARHAETLDILSPIVSSTEAALAGVQDIRKVLGRLENGQQVITGVLETLAARSSSQGRDSEAMRDEIAALADGIDRYNALVEELKGVITRRLPRDPAVPPLEEVQDINPIGRSEARAEDKEQGHVTQ